jgi:hypothetical protein
LQDGYDVSRLFRILPDARVLIGVPVRDDVVRDLERSRNAIRFNQRVFPKLQFREIELVHFKFHIFFLKDDVRYAFIGSMNLTANRWEEIMYQVPEFNAVNELCLIYEHYWKKGREVKPHKEDLVATLAQRVTKRAMDTER